MPFDEETHASQHQHMFEQALVNGMIMEAVNAVVSRRSVVFALTWKTRVLQASIGNTLTV